MQVGKQIYYWYLDTSREFYVAKPAHIESRRTFYDWLASTIKIDGIRSVERDYEFDDDRFRNGGIRLHYEKQLGAIQGLKDGILLEVGFDDVTLEPARGRFGPIYKCTNKPDCKFSLTSRPTGQKCEYAGRGKKICGKLIVEGTKTIPDRCSDKGCPNRNPNKLKV